MKSTGASGISCGFQRSGSGGMSTPSRAPVLSNACDIAAYGPLRTDGWRR